MYISMKGLQEKQSYSTGPAVKNEVAACGGAVCSNGLQGVTKTFTYAQEERQCMGLWVYTCIILF